MNAPKKEIVFFGIIALLSLASLDIPGVYSGPSEIIDFRDIKIKSSEDITYSLVDRSDTENIVFYGGYPSELKEHKVHSDFYTGNINLTRTSVYWRTPVNVSQSLLVGNKEGDEYNLQLFLKENHHLPVISVVCDPEDFFSYQKGIYVEGSDADFMASKKFYPMAWHQPANYFRNSNDERKVHFTYYDDKGKVKYQSYALAEINGNATRCLPQKSVRLTANKDIGSKYFEFDFFGKDKKYKSIVLRNGGNDNTKSLFRDMLMQQLMEASGITVSGFIPCEVYLNGQYWGIHFIQNRLDDNFIAENWSEKEKNVTIVEDWLLDKGEEREFKKLMKLVSDKNNYLTYDNIVEQIDEDDFISYLIGEIYFANTDWPENNLKMYKISGGKNESKWKFAFFDLDYGFGYTGEEAYNYDMFAHLNGRNDPCSRVFKAMMKNEHFRSKLKAKFELLLKNVLSPENMNQKIDEYRQLLLPAINNHTERWQKPATTEEWELEVEGLINFANKRNAEIEKQIQKYLK